jgi:hypothetical protein
VVVGVVETSVIGDVKPTVDEIDPRMTQIGVLVQPDQAFEER